MVVVKAISQASSRFARQVMIDPRQYPCLLWRWNAEPLPTMSDFTRKEGDDYAARVYVGSKYETSRVGFFEIVKFEVIKLVQGRYPPLNAISDIWDTLALVGTITPNPHTNPVQMIAAKATPMPLNSGLQRNRTCTRAIVPCSVDPPSHDF